MGYTVQIYYSIEWAPFRGGPHCRPIGVWAIGDGADICFAFLPGYKERFAGAEVIRKRLLSLDCILVAEEILNEQVLGVAAGLGHCGPITHADSFASLTECVQSVLGILEKQWDTKKMRWRSGLKMPLERYKLNADS